ncbi:MULTISPECIES: VanZ family protein [Nostocales]|uniref:Laminin n=3 Tax=Nostocales TaxID=1161 RepID=A0A0C1RJH1_9CYAN|nr:VanZ family protein [Tolypothrix bouteillei]KAF3890523.1 VanZ family protein [Tolypothrix bouteillei VB521301]
MKQGKNFFPKNTLLNRGIFAKDIWMVLGSILVVLVATLYPFNFSSPENFSIRKIPSQFESTSDFIDQVNNILLFIPFGFSLGNALQKIRRIPLLGKIVLVFLGSAGLSLTVELLQIFLPSREPTPADLINNSISGLVGLLCFYLCASQHLNSLFSSIENSKLARSTQKISLFFCGYILLAFTISIVWLGTTNLSGWNPNYPLILGNETTGNRPWQGYISKIYIADRAISKSEVEKVFVDENYLKTLGDSLVTSYQFPEQCCQPEETVKSPKLREKKLWWDRLSENQQGQGVFLSPGNWLETANPVTSLNKRIRETSELTISTTVASSDISQTGPARIISVSNGPLRRNFTLGQERTALDLRIRTSITGENGSELKMRVPNVFTDNNPHHIVLTYSKGTLQVYIDTLSHFSTFNLLDLIPKQQQIFYYAITFIPLGICLTIITVLARRKIFLYRFLLFSGILLPSLILESILVSENGKSISLRNFLLGIFFTTGTVLVLRLRALMVMKKTTV